MARRPKQMSLFQLSYHEAVTTAKKNLAVHSRISELQAELAVLYATPGDRVTVHSPMDAAQIVMYDMSALTVEELWIINLNTRNGLIAVRKIYRGSTNSSQVHIGNLFRLAIIDNAQGVIVVHNHPSGDPSPSPDDTMVTRALVQAGKLLDIPILDHLVIAGGRFVSMKERGLGW